MMLVECGKPASLASFYQTEPFHGSSDLLIFIYYSMCYKNSQEPRAD